MTWRRIIKGTRDGFAIINDSSAAVYVSINDPAEVNKGIRLNANGGSWVHNEDNFQGSINAIAGSTNNNVTALEW
jgi:hypothetical protein